MKTHWINKAHSYGCFHLNSEKQIVLIPFCSFSLNKELPSNKNCNYCMKLHGSKSALFLFRDNAWLYVAPYLSFFGNLFHLIRKAMYKISCSKALTFSDADHCKIKIRCPNTIVIFTKSAYGLMGKTLLDPHIKNFISV